MPDISEMISLEAVPWVAAASLLVAGVSMACSAFSVAIAWKSWRLNKKKDDRSRQNISIYYAEGFVSNDVNGRSLAFLVTITNVSEVASSIVQSELWITYTSQQGAVLTISLTPNGEALAAFPEITDRTLVPPIRLDGGQAATGWIGFLLPRGAIALGARIDGYEVRMLGPSGMVGSFVPLVLIERVRGPDEVKKNAAPENQE